MTPKPPTSNTPAVAMGALTAPRARRSAPKGGKPPTALTERRLSLICERIANGVPMTTAAVASGVPRRTFQDWLAKGRHADAEEPYKSMADRIESALAVYHESRVELVQVGAEKDPRMAFQELERRFKSDWGDPRVAGGVTVNVGVILESPEWLELRGRLLRALAPFPEALEAVVLELAGGQVVEGSAVELEAG